MREMDLNLASPKRIEYEPLEYQRAFHLSTKPKSILSTGFGGGKTFALVMKGFDLMNSNRGLPGGLLCPDYKMYKRDVLPTIEDICIQNKIKYDYHKVEMKWTFPAAGATMYAFTSEKPGSIKGPNLAWFLVNEVGECSKESVMMAIGRVRLKKAKRLQIAMSGTPEGFNWVYDYFVQTPREDTDLIFGDARLNTHVHEAYFKQLEESYDPLLQDQYIRGLFVNVTGKRCVWAFDRHRHVVKGIKKIPGMPVWITLDFNVNPMAATLWNVIPMGYQTPEGRRAKLRAFKTIKIMGSNTYEMADALRNELEKGPGGEINDHVTVYPDPAGRALSTKTLNLSDFDILKQKGFTELKYKLKFSVKDCLVALNNLFSKDEIVIDAGCTDLIADLEQCVFKGNAFEIDKSNPDRTHWLDSAKLMADYEFGISRPSFREHRFR